MLQWYIATRLFLQLNIAADCWSWSELSSRLLRVTPRRSSRNPAYYLSDLDFADDIALLSRNMSTAQKILIAVENSAILVGLTINKSKTTYMVCGEVTADVGVQEPVTLSVDAGAIVKVDDFRYLGVWLKSSDDDFRHRVPRLGRHATRCGGYGSVLHWVGTANERYSKLQLGPSCFTWFASNSYVANNYYSR